MSRRSSVAAVPRDGICDLAISVGDHVRIGTIPSPHFEVLAVRGDNAWVRNLSDGSDHLALTARCRKVDASPLATAAE